MKTTTNDIIKTGFFQSTKDQRKIVSSIADDSFTSSLPTDFLGDFRFPEFSINYQTGIALKLKHVEAHTDYWAGPGIPKKWVSIFWLIKCPSHAKFRIHVGRDSLLMEEGDFIIFDDRIMHSVYSEKQWIGCAYQAIQNLD